MAWTRIFLLWIASATALAYRQIHNPAYHTPYFGGFSYDPPAIPRVNYRRDAQETRESEQETERVPSERSIPFSANAQRVQGDSQSRNLNSSLKILNTKNHPSVQNRRADPDSIVFPGPTARPSPFVPVIPKQCMDFGICENIPNYPSDHVNNLISQVRDPYRFNLDRDVPEIAQRRGPGEEDMELCEHNETIIYPSAAKNIQGRWVIIVNNKEKPVQGFKAEICVNVDKSCSKLAYFPDRYNATCHQKMVERNMWSVDQAGEMVLESVLVPSCCTCVVRAVQR